MIISSTLLESVIFSRLLLLINQAYMFPLTIQEYIVSYQYINEHSLKGNTIKPDTFNLYLGS